MNLSRQEMSIKYFTFFPNRSPLTPTVFTDKILEAVAAGKLDSVGHVDTDSVEVIIDPGKKREMVLPMTH